MVERLASFLKQILKRNVTVVNNGVGSMCATVAEASIWMHLTNCPNACSSTDFFEIHRGAWKGEVICLCVARWGFGEESTSLADEKSPLAGESTVKEQNVWVIWRRVAKDKRISAGQRVCIQLQRGGMSAEMISRWIREETGKRVYSVVLLSSV